MRSAFASESLSRISDSLVRSPARTFPVFLLPACFHPETRSTKIENPLASGRERILEGGVRSARAEARKARGRS